MTSISPMSFVAYSKLFLFSWHRRGGPPLLFLGNLLCVEKQIRWKKQSLPKPSWKTGCIQLAYTPSDMLWVFGGNFKRIILFFSWRGPFLYCMCVSWENFRKRRFSPAWESRKFRRFKIPISSFGLSPALESNSSEEITPKIRFDFPGKKFEKGKVKWGKEEEGKNAFFSPLALEEKKEKLGM